MTSSSGSRKTSNSDSASSNLRSGGIYCSGCGGNCVSYGGGGSGGNYGGGGVSGDGGAGGAGYAIIQEYK